MPEDLSIAALRPETLGIGRLFWMISDAVVVGDATSGRIVLWNPAAERMFGYTMREIVGQPIDVLVPAHLSDAHRHGLAQYDLTGHGKLIDNGTPVELPALRKSGDVAWVELSLNRIDDVSAGRRLVLAVIRDVTSRRQAEGERRERLRVEALAAERSAILDQIVEGVIITDAQGIITYVNAAAARLHGVARTGVPVEGYASAYRLFTINGQPYPAEELPLARAVRSDEVVLDARWRIDRPDGTQVVAEGSAAPVRAADGSRLGSVLVMRDVTDQTALEQEKDDFLAAVSHDLKSPLASVRTIAQLLQRQARSDAPIPPERLVARLSAIEQATIRMTTLLDQLVDLARLGMDRPLEMDLRPTDLVDLAHTVVAAQQATTERHALRVQTKLTELVGEWDPSRLERILVNLLENAIKYSPAGGDIDVRLDWLFEDQQDWAVIEVADHGIGIPAADLPYVFERFRRGRNVVGQILGTGIGLAAVRRIAEGLGGSVNVHSIERAGTTFTVRLPRAPA